MAEFGPHVPVLLHVPCTKENPAPLVIIKRETTTSGLPPVVLVTGHWIEGKQPQIKDERRDRSQPLVVLDERIKNLQSFPAEFSTPAMYPLLMTDEPLRKLLSSIPVQSQSPPALPSSAQVPPPQPWMPTAYHPAYANVLPVLGPYLSAASHSTLPTVSIVPTTASAPLSVAPNTRRKPVEPPISRKIQRKQPQYVANNRSEPKRRVRFSELPPEKYTYEKESDEEGEADESDEYEYEDEEERFYDDSPYHYYENDDDMAIQTIRSAHAIRRPWSTGGMDIGHKPVQRRHSSHHPSPHFRIDRPSRYPPGWPAMSRARFHAYHTEV
ncbi:hypothetical protein EC973_002922 [Apophysomyces ossiformis]|uniref:Uncharacterized protein n=1 Tax=Apophysomyces ossiformis TaxID=679940 RepID=A0A8H7BK05_9FUNG|nr:hypothetical protein EC973_002922 [Apophysomyces ossiformis]